MTDWNKIFGKYVYDKGLKSKSIQRSFKTQQKQIKTQLSAG